jgi:hypothetical protein
MEDMMVDCKTLMIVLAGIGSSSQADTLLEIGKEALFLEAASSWRIACLEAKSASGRDASILVEVEEWNSRQARYLPYSQRLMATGDCVHLHPLKKPRLYVTALTEPVMFNYGTSRNALRSGN